MTRQQEKRLIKLGRRLAAVEDLSRDPREVATDLGMSMQFVHRWRARLQSKGYRVNGLLDAERAGRPSYVSILGLDRED